MGLKSLSGVVGTGYLPPGESVTWFWDNARRNAVRWFSARPGNGGSVPWDQMVEITSVVHLLKGTNHASEGPTVVDSLQPNVTVTNRDQLNGLFYVLYFSEIYEE